MPSNKSLFAFDPDLSGRGFRGVCSKILNYNKYLLNNNSNKILYNPGLKILARKLRNNSTHGEIALWKVLKKKQMRGYDFHRQKPVDNYILDFFCYKLKLAIEIDGFSHEGERIKKDEVRQQKIESYGIKFLRFTEREVLNNINGVWNMINDWIEKFEKEQEHTPNHI